jgi:hypothetical protein
MCKRFLIIFIPFVFISASEIKEICAKDMSVMMSSYYQAQKDQRELKTSAATEAYQNSIDSAYKALESCKDSKDYDFNIMYGFILESEKRLYE